MTLRIIQGYDWLPSGAVSGAGAGPQPGSIQDFLSKDGQFFYPIGDANDPQYVINPGRFSGNALWCLGGTTSGSALSWFNVEPTGVSVSEETIGFGVYRGAVSSGNPCFGFFDASNTAPQLTVEFAPFGIVKLWRGAPNPNNISGVGHLLAATPVGTFLNDVWFYAELQATIDGAAGAAVVKINAGVPAHETGIVISLSGVNTQATAANTIDSICTGQWQANSGYLTWALDDGYVCDAAGGVNNDFLGNVKAQQCRANSAGASTTFLIGGSSPAATNWQSVSNWDLDEDTYVYTPTTGNYDLYGVAPLITPGAIFGVQVRGAMRQDDATEIEGQNLIDSAGTIVAGAPALMNQLYSYLKDIYELDPATSLGWLAAAVNAVQIGPKKAA